MAIGNLHIEPVAVHAEAAIADGAAIAGWVSVVPEFATGARKSTAQALSGVAKYRMPLTMSGVALMEEWQQQHLHVRRLPGLLLRWM